MLNISSKTKIRIFIIICLILFEVFFMYQHELIHQEIARIHGCNNYSIIPGIEHWQMVCYSYDARTYETSLQEDKLHSWNEIIGYYLQALSLILWFHYFIWMLKEDFKENEMR